jgi:hypothetical protein
MSRVELRSPLSPSECVVRLSGAIDSERMAYVSLAGLFGSKPVAGYVTESSLRLRRRIYYRNSFQTFLTATLRPDGSGTSISGELGIHPAARWFMMIWFGFVGVVGGVMVVASLFGTLRTDGSPWVGAAVLPGMLGFGIAIVQLGRWLARKEGTFLIDFLVQTLEAHETTGPSALRPR